MVVTVEALNAAVRSIFYRAKDKYNLDVYGILEGTVGFMERPPRYIKLDYGTFSGNLIRQGWYIFRYNK